MSSVRLTQRQKQLDKSSSSMIRDNGLFNQIETMMTIEKQNESHPTLQSHSEIVLQVYPEYITIGPSNTSELCTCSITMRYRSDPTLPSMATHSRRDEIKVFQMTKDGFQWIVFQGFLRMHDSFTFKSQRSRNDRLYLELEINGSLDTTLSACCEHPYHQGGRIDDGDSSFWIDNIQQYTSCAKCNEKKTQTVKESTKEQSEAVIDQIRSQTTIIKPANNESQLFKDIQEIMQKGLSVPPVSSQTINNVENLAILYIDENESRNISHLRSVVSYIHAVRDLDALKTFLGECQHEKLIAIVPFDQAETYFSHLRNHQSVHSIYFLSKHQIDFPSWTSPCEKILERFPTIDAIRTHLASRLISFEVTSDPSFLYCQLLKETMLCEDEESDLKKDMLAFCHLHYTSDETELVEFETTFVETNSIQWYTRDCFLTRILSRAFRTHEVDLLFKMRYFIQSLHKQIQAIPIKETLTVYTVADVEEERFQKNINGLVIFHSFLPATIQKPIIAHTRSKSVIFSIRIDHPDAANIEQQRWPDSKIDVLINLDALFRIISVDKDEHGIPLIHLQSVSQDDPPFQQLTSPLRTEIKRSVVILQLTKLLLETNHYAEADSLTESIYQDQSFHHDGTLLAALAAAHQLLANVNADKKDYPTSRYQYYKALRAFLVFLPYDHHLIASIYNNTGSMFYQSDIHAEAIKFHQMALDCQMRAENPSMTAMSTYAANIGAVYMNQKNYSEAFKPLLQAAKILEQISTKDIQKRLISIYQKIASCFWRSNRTEEALEYYQKILQRQLALPDPLPHPLSVTYYNLSTAYERLGDYDQGVICAQKSVDHLKMISETHAELKENQGQLDSVREKQWLKEILH